MLGSPKASCSEGDASPSYGEVTASGVPSSREGWHILLGKREDRQGPSALARGGKCSEKGAKSFKAQGDAAPASSEAQIAWSSPLDRSSLSLPRHRSESGGWKQLHEEFSSQPLLPGSGDESIIECNTNVFSVLLPHPLGFLDVP